MFLLFALFSDEPEVFLPKYSQTAILHAAHFRRVVKCSFYFSHTSNPITLSPLSVGAFQSDALLVPEHCLFDHIHKTDDCKSPADWRRVSVDACANRGLVQQSSAMLLPCGVDVFGGVEFVCCPKTVASKNGKSWEFG